MEESFWKSSILRSKGPLEAQNCILWWDKWFSITPWMVQDCTPKGATLHLFEKAPKKVLTVLHFWYPFGCKIAPFYRTKGSILHPKRCNRPIAPYHWCKIAPFWKDAIVHPKRCSQCCIFCTIKGAKVAPFLFLSVYTRQNIQNKIFILILCFQTVF